MSNSNLAKHTPGPWAVEQGEHHHRGSTVITARHAGMTPNTPLAHVGNLLGIEEAAPDAHLIAAAPEMLRALELIVNSDMAMREEDEGNISTELAHARAAIAKATGSEAA